MGTLRELKRKMRLDKDLRPMLVRSLRHELLLDLDGDKVADIALIDNNHDGDIDMIAVDATGNGDFNLFLGDQDCNGIPDIVEFYRDGDDMPTASYFGRNVEDRFLEIGERIYRRILAKELIAADLIAEFNVMVARAMEEYARLAPESEEVKEVETARKGVDKACIHPDLREVYNNLPENNMVLNAETAVLVRQSIVMPKMADLGDDPDLLITRLSIPGPAGDIAQFLVQPTPKGDKLYPVVLDIHGGGMFYGTAEDAASLMAEAAKKLGYIYVSPEYRLAPEHPYPAALDDCYATLLWIHDHIQEYHGDPDKIIVMGGSAGGGLAAATALRARDENGPRIAFQCLIYPMIDDRLDSTSKYITDNRISNRSGCAGMWDMYLGNLKGGDVPCYAAPARAKDFSNLPPAFLAVGGSDPFCDETVYYAQQLMLAGIPTELHVFPGCFHAWDAYGAGTQVSDDLYDIKFHALAKAFEWL